MIIRGLECMGEIIKVYKTEGVIPKNCRMELNYPIDYKEGGDIHIHYNNFRLEFTQKQFYEIASSFIEAKRKLVKTKRMENI